MTIEKLAYKMVPAGHEEQQPKRKYSEPDKRLAQAFEEWRKGVDDHCDHLRLLTFAEKCLRESFSVDEAHALLLSRQKDLFTCDGIFLSAVYKRAPEQVIVFDLDIPMPLDYVGFELPKDKTLINFGNLYRSAAFLSKGTFVNYGKTRLGFGAHNSGIIINYAPLDPLDELGGMSKGPVLNLEVTHKNLIFKTRTCTVRHFLDWKEVFVMERKPVYDEKRHNELFRYIDKLQSNFEKGRNDYKQALETLQQLGNDPSKKINDDIEDILTRAGYDIKT